MAIVNGLNGKISGELVIRGIGATNKDIGLTAV
jgi:hypothetical protein